MSILCHGHKHTHWSNQVELLCVLSVPNPYTISFPTAETGSFYTKSIPFPLTSFPPYFFPLSHSTFQSHHIYCDVLSCLSNHFYPKVVANFHPKTVYVSLAYDSKLRWIPSHLLHNPFICLLLLWSHPPPQHCTLSPGLPFLLPPAPSLHHLCPYNSIFRVVPVLWNFYIKGLCKNQAWPDLHLLNTLPTWQYKMKF